MKKYFLMGILCSVAACAGAQTTLTQTWRVDWKTRHWFAGTSDTVRSVDYNPATDHVTVVSRDVAAYGAGVSTFAVLNAATGADVSTNSLAAAVGGTFNVNKHAHDDAGVAYIGNLTRNWSSDAFRIYRLAGENDALTTAYASVSNDAGTTLDQARLGDTLDVTGSGLSTEIWCGTRAVAGPHLVKFTTTNGTTFQPTTFLTIPGNWASSGSPTYRGLSVSGTGASASIWVKDINYNVMKINPITGAIDDTITTAVLSDAVNTLAIGQFQSHGQKLVALGPGNVTATNVQRPGYLVKVTVPATKQVVGNTVSLQTGTFANGNQTGGVTFDPTRNNVIFLVTNNTLSAHNVPASVNAAENWNLLD